MESIPVPLKLGAILAASLLMTCLCFMVMYALISTDARRQNVITPSLVTPVVVEPRLDRTLEELRRKPRRVIPAEIPPEPHGKPLRLATPVAVRAEIPSRSSIAELMGTDQIELSLDPPLQDIVPLYVVQPVYPFKAVMKNIEGYVVVSFTVRENGSVINPSIVDSEPGDIFDQAALSAMSKFRFQPRRAGVDNIAVPNLELKFVFELDGVAMNIGQLE
jgi:protein TonB